MSGGGKFSKRGKNPGATDSWLDSLGYYRKNVAYDETCLFRAISEQVLSTQIDHEEVRRKCVEYGRENSREFQHLIPKKKDWLDRLRKLSVHMVVCTEIEVQLVCNTYKVNIKLFNSITREIRDFRGSFYDDKKCTTLLLCKMGEDHYDAVYTKDYIANAGFCQSLVYNVLYDGVFEIPNVESVVHSMLHDKQAPYTTFYTDNNNQSTEDEDALSFDDLPSGSTSQQSGMVAPFPFKIAKALDPNMYRNIEYDTWLELRREMRLGDWYFGDDKLILGTRCIAHLGDEDYECYIQEMFENDNNKCEVYVTKLAKRLIVDYDKLRPEDNAKPWPLPYRFARNQSTPFNSPANDTERKTLRKRREKKRSQSVNEDSSKDITDYEGCPLLMKEVHEIIALEKLSTAMQMSDSSPEHEHSETSRNLVDFIPWSQSTSSPEEDYQKEIASSTNRSFEDSNEQLVYSYTSEAPYSPVPAWSQPPTSYVVSPDSALCESEVSLRVDYRNSNKYVYYQADNGYSTPTYVPSSVPPSPAPFSPFPAVYPVERPPMPSTASPQVDMYPVFYPVPSPLTPMYYSHASTPTPPPRSQEFMIPQYNSPTIDMQYVSSPAYVYPPTPPMAWFNASHPINSQGFIFPQAVNTNINAA